jgi:Family of unknown function (DUF5681)
MAEEFDERRRPRRDRKGRWSKGSSGNPYGRPRKYKIIFSEEDPYDFACRVIPVTQNGKTEWITRKAALHRKLFEQAMRGGVLASRTLLKRIDDWSMMRARAKNRLEELEFKYTLDPKLDPPPEVDLEIQKLRLAVSHDATNAPFGSIDMAESLRKNAIDLRRKWAWEDRQREAARRRSRNDGGGKAKSETDPENES